jgi:uncharacterized protein
LGIGKYSPMTEYSIVMPRACARCGLRDPEPGMDSGAKRYAIRISGSIPTGVDALPPFAAAARCRQRSRTHGHDQYQRPSPTTWPALARSNGSGFRFRMRLLPYGIIERSTMYYILFYTTVDDYVERRTPFRDEHLAYARAAQDRGELILAGALAEPADSAVLVFKADSPRPAEDFARGDVYVREGVVTAWKVRPWTVVIGGDR